MKISNNFTLEEFVNSSTAKAKKIDNTPSDKVKNNIIILVKELLQPIRDAWKDSIVVTSGYRCPKLNTAVGGAKNSQHMYGSACDFKAKDSKKNKDLFNLILSMKKLGTISFRQLIWEKGTKQNPQWIHISIQDEHFSHKNNEVLYLI